MSEDQIKRFIINLEDDGSVKEWKAEYTDPRGNAGDPNYEITPKAAESESFSLSRPKQIEDVMDDIANEKPESSSEFDEAAAQKKSLELADKNRGRESDSCLWGNIEMMEIARWQHARDAEEIISWREKNLGLVLEREKLTEENQRLRAQLNPHTGESFSEFERRDLIEENQRLRVDAESWKEVANLRSDQTVDLEERIEKLRDAMNDSIKQMGKNCCKYEQCTCAMNTLQYALASDEKEGS